MSISLTRGQDVSLKLSVTLLLSLRDKANRQEKRVNSESLDIAKPEVQLSLLAQLHKSLKSVS